MAVSQGPRVGVTRWSAGTDTFTRAQLDADHEKIDRLTAIDIQDVIAARPAAGIRGRYFWATDEELLYRDTGSTWRLAGPQVGGITPTSSAPSDVGAQGSSKAAARADHKHAREPHGPDQHTDYARKDGAQFTGELTFTGTNHLLLLRRYAEMVTNPTVGATTTLDCTNGMVHSVTLTQNTTLAITGISTVAGRASAVTLILRQDASGGRTVTWPTGTKWPDGVVPSLSTAANAVNVVTLLTPDGGGVWYGYLVGRDMK